jgi:hypothetical protein
MAITSGDTYIASSKQILPFTKTASVTTVATTRFTTFGVAGNPGAGTRAMTTALTGAVPNGQTDAGYPIINNFGGSNTGYLTRVQYNNSVATRMELWDKLFGISVAVTALGTTTLASQASYSGRVPGGTNYAGLRLFMEITTATAGATAATVTVTYTNQAGTTGRTTGTITLATYTVDRWIELPLQAGDSGIQKIETVVVGGTAATAGVMNIIVVRPLWANRVNVTNTGSTDGLDRTGMPQVWATSALVLTTVADSTSSGIPDLNIEIANG